MSLLFSIIVVIWREAKYPAVIYNRTLHAFSKCNTNQINYQKICHKLQGFLGKFLFLFTILLSLFLHLAQNKKNNLNSSITKDFSIKLYKNLNKTPPKLKEKKIFVHLPWNQYNNCDKTAWQNAILHNTLNLFIFLSRVNLLTCKLDFKR